MGLAIKEIEAPFDTRLTTIATVTTLGGTSLQTFSAITVNLPESSRTILFAELLLYFREADTTTNRRLNGVRVGIQVDAVAFNDVDLTGTGIAPTGAMFSAQFSRDVTSYMVTNFTGTSHTVGARIEVQTDVASVVNNMTAKLRIVYQYDDTSATQTKTVRIPLEGITGFLSTSANANFQGSTGAAQIPNLDTFLPEASKTYKHIWFEVTANDSAAAATDFNVNYSIDGGTTATRATLESFAATDGWFFDIWLQNSLVTSSTHNFQAWSSLASRFERMSVVLHVTYTYDLATTSTLINSILLPIKHLNTAMNSTTSGDQDLIEHELWIQETTVTMRQSALFLTWENAGSGNISVVVAGTDAAGGSQGSTTSVYTGTGAASTGGHMLCHRLDVAHGGSAVTLGRGKNRLLIKLFASVTRNVCAVTGVLIINYTSDKSAAGVGAHNATTHWKGNCLVNEGVIAGDIYGELPSPIAPAIPQSNYYMHNFGMEIKANSSNSAGWAACCYEVLSGEFNADGWITTPSVNVETDNEFGTRHWFMNHTEYFKRYPQSPLALMNPEGARKIRYTGVMRIQGTIGMMLTMHAITYTVSGTVSASAGGTVNLALLDATTHEILATTTRAGDGAYSFTWYDNTRSVYVKAFENDTHKGSSKEAVAGSGFDVRLSFQAAYAG